MQEEQNEFDLPKMKPINLDNPTEDEVKSKMPSSNPMNDKAEEIIKDRSKLRLIADRARFLVSNLVNASDILIFYRMIDNHLRGTRPLHTTTLIVVAAGLIYVVNPVDLVPDAIPIFGYTDDLAIIAQAAKLIQTDVDDFRRWEKKNKDSTLTLTRSSSNGGKCCCC